MLISSVQQSDSVIHISRLLQTLSPYRLLQNIVLSSLGKESTCNAWDPSSIPGSGRSAGEGIGYPLQYSGASLVAQLVKESTCNAGDLGSIPRLGRSPGAGKGYPLQYSCLENPRDWGAWWAAVYGVTQGQTRLKRLSGSSREEDQETWLDRGKPESWMQESMFAHLSLV